MAGSVRREGLAMAVETSSLTERQLAFHESGHAVLAAQLGVSVERVSIVPMEGVRSYAKLAAHPNLDTAEYLVVLLAGEEAQRRLEGGEPVATGDREQARHVLAAAGIDEAKGQELLSGGRERAVGLLAQARTWRQVEAVAAALLAEGTLDGHRFRDVVAGA